ncbi:MAG TPA: F0F1 ATP synthase subunit B [Terriglobia bacterium]|jgi:F-type H+-transporting ATPase subunit b|nr:F0F1 ATP synthase subunit B [Terriglobia bacterium]
MNNPLVQPDPGLFIWTIITFLLLLALLAKYAWKPLLAFLASREETIKTSLENAQTAKKELERIQQESAQIIRKAHGEAESIVSRSWSDAEKVREEMKQKAKTEADAIVKESQRQIELETGRALRQIRSEVADLSIAIASKVIQRNVSKEDNSRLIEDTLKQIDSGRSN